MEIKNVIHYSDKTLSLRKQDIVTTNLLLKKSIKGESDVSKQQRRINAARKFSFSSNIFPLICLFCLAVRKRRRTQDIAETTEGETKVVEKKRTGLYMV